MSPPRDRHARSTSWEVVRRERRAVGGLKNFLHAGKALAGVGGKQVAAVGDQARDGVALGGGVVGTRESVQVREREAAPGSAKHGQRGNAVGWVKDGTGERGEVEDLLALIERGDFYGAVG